MNKRLVILSVPNIRVARLLLSDAILELIKINSNLLIITPFAENNQFKNEFDGSGIFFCKVSISKRASRLIKKLYAMSELLRILGCYRRNRHNGLEYYYLNATKQYGIDGDDTVDSLTIRIAKYIISLTGLWRGFWRVFEHFFGTSLFRSQQLENIIKPYNSVTLIQSASWGDQDRILAWYARRLNFRSILIPYTTDQLWVNGDLLCDYDAVCVQGAFETFCANEYHKIADSRIVQLGSLWFRTIDRFVLNRSDLQRKENHAQVVVYAGLSRIYSPQESEFKAIDALIIANQKGLFGNIKLVYRPGAMTTEERAVISARYCNANIHLQWPEEVCGGLYDYSGDSVRSQLVDYIGALVEYDLLIMAQTTSLALDAAYLGSGIIADFSDDSGVLARRETHHRFVENGNLIALPGVPVVRSSSELVAKVCELLHDKNAIKRSTDGILEAWDYSPHDWPQIFGEVIFGEIV